jgi:hypothetical protein
MPPTGETPIRARRDSNTRPSTPETSAERASTILSELYNEHNRLKPVGKPRGRGELVDLNGAKQ